MSSATWNSGPMRLESVVGLVLTVNLDPPTPSRIAAVSTYLQGEFPPATISVVARQSLDAHLFRIDMEDGKNPYDVLVLNEVLRVLSEATIPERFTAWNVSSLMRVAVGTVEITVAGALDPKARGMTASDARTIAPYFGDVVRGTREH